MFERTLFAGWGDMDSNARMRHTAHLDRSAYLRTDDFQERVPRPESKEKP